MPELQLLPRFERALEPHTEDELAKLEADVRAFGCLDPLIVWQGRDIILDGMTRYRICRKHGIGFRTKELPFPSEDAAELWLLKHQLGRRNLTPGAKALRAARIAALEARCSASGSMADAIRTAAADAGVSPRSVERAQRVLNRGSPELQQAVESGAVSLGQADELTKMSDGENAQLPADAGVSGSRQIGENPPKTHDKYGNPLPESACGAFEEAGRLKALARDVARVRACGLKALGEDRPGWEALDRARFQHVVDQLYSLLKNATPHALCPTCGGDAGTGEGACRMCEGRGWLAYFRYKTAIPEEAKWENQRRRKR